MIRGVEVNKKVNFTLKMEAAKSSETLISYRRTTWRHNPADWDLEECKTFFHFEVDLPLFFRFFPCSYAYLTVIAFHLLQIQVQTCKVNYVK
jgi:hypothetical protein